MKKWIIRLAALVLFIFFLSLVITGQKTVGLMYLLRMIVGLAGLLGMLFYYNVKHR